jgi:hypothetical protein
LYTFAGTDVDYAVYRFLIRNSTIDRFDNIAGIDKITVLERPVTVDYLSFFCLIDENPDNPRRARSLGG